MRELKFKLSGTYFYITTQPDPCKEYSEVKLSPNESATLKEMLLGSSDKMKWPEFVALWNSYAEKNGWRLITEKNKDAHKRFSVAVKTFPKADDWKIIIEAMERDQFYSGKSGIYTNPCALTLFRDSRYCSFYEAGTINRDKQPQTVDSILDHFRDLLKEIK